MANKQFKDFDLDNTINAADVFLYQQDADNVYKKITYSGLEAAIGASLGLGSSPTFDDKDLAAAITVADGDTAGVSITNAPAGFVSVMINGLLVNLGSGVKTKDCYFSNDGGTTARTFASIINGDVLYWNGSIAGYELAVADKIDLLYNA